MYIYKNPKKLKKLATAGVIKITIPVRRGGSGKAVLDNLLGDHESLDVTGAPEAEVADLARYYEPRYRAHPDFNIYYARNQLLIQLARDCAADQRLEFVYKREAGRVLFVSDENVFLDFLFEES